MRHSAHSVVYGLLQPLLLGDVARHVCMEHAGTILARCHTAMISLTQRRMGRGRSEDSHLEIWLAGKYRYSRSISARAWRRHSGYLVHRVAFERQRCESEQAMRQALSVAAARLCPQPVAACEPDNCSDQRCSFAVRKIRRLPAWSTGTADMGLVDDELSSLAGAPESCPRKMDVATAESDCEGTARGRV